MQELRQRLSPRGDMVSQEGRRRTEQIFGEPMTPAGVVERICTDVAQKGLEAVLDYSARIDKAELTPETLRVSQEELDEAHRQADPELLRAVRSIRGRVEEFQQAILHEDVRVQRPGGYLRQRYQPLDRVGICVPGGAAAYRRRY